MIKTKESKTYDFVSRSIGAVPTHEFDWDLDIYLDVSGQEQIDSNPYHLHREVLFRVAVAASDELGFLIAQCGMKGECRARLIAISVEELDVTDYIYTNWQENYDLAPSFRSDVQKARAFRVVVTISQTVCNDVLSEQLDRNFKAKFLDRLSASLAMSRDITYPYCETRPFNRSRHLIPSLNAGTLLERARDPKKFGFHESGNPSLSGLTLFETPWLKTKIKESSFLRLKAQFTLQSSPQDVWGVGASEVLLETLISFSYQLGLLKASVGCPSSSLRAIEFARASTEISRRIPVDREHGTYAPQVDVSILLPLDMDLSLNQAWRNKLRFFVDKDIRKTFGLTSRELELPHPHMHALVHNVFLKQFND